jgi:tRNA threonylcarbamoyladenosine biosynthesis protein TsaE
MQKSKSNQETLEIGKNIAKNLKGGDIMLLKGDLGAGKTTLTKGIAMGLGITDDIVSPTFTLMQIYPINNHPPKADPSGAENLVHVDTYRLEHEEDLVDIGIEDYLGDKNTICIIEWPEKISGLLKNKKTIEITIAHVKKDEREITKS